MRGSYNMSLILLILLKLFVSACVVKLARHKHWNMLYVVPLMAVLWIPIVIYFVMEYIL